MLPVARYVQNAAELLSHGSTSLRSIALTIAESAIAAADPGTVLRRLVKIEGSRFHISDHEFDLSSGARIFIIGAGKATYPIAEFLDATLGDRIHAGFVTCKNGQRGDLKHIELHWAGHPIPDEESHRAAMRTKELLREVRPGDIVIACFTGGSSALFVDPIEPLTLADKTLTNQILLGCGANIIEINAVRKHLSRVKGGRLASNLPAGVHLINLTVSDVIGDRLDYITDPTVPDTSSFSDARATLDKYGLWDVVPTPVASRLRRGCASEETIREAGFSHLNCINVVLVGADAACHAAASAARAHGFAPLILSTVFEGESRELGRFMAAAAKQAAFDGHPVSPPCVLIGGGESTVRVENGAGYGGPNQEFALAFALDVEGSSDVVALSIDTDGTDGPTAIAGGLVDGSTVVRGRALGLDLYGHLARHDASSPLRRLGDAVVTGATGTNVNDLRLIVIGTPEGKGSDEK